MKIGAVIVGLILASWFTWACWRKYPNLLKLILGTLQPTKGEVYIHGQSLNDQPGPQVGYVPQLETVDWNFPVTVEEVVLMGRVWRVGIWPWPSADDKRRVQNVLE